MTDTRWEDARRLEAWAGEVRVNLLRAAALVAFYGYHLLNVYLISKDESLRGAYHAKVTAVVLAWALAVGVLYVCLSRRWAPPALKYVAVAWDLVMVTALLLIDRKDGPHSPFVALYFLVIATAPLRMWLPLVYAATLGAMAAAALMMGVYVFGVVGSEAYYAAEPNVYRVPLENEVIFLLALGVAGLLAGQVVRQARRLVEGYPVTVAAEAEEARDAAGVAVPPS
jgi:hypothetical protein